jgi:hypothetical protein
MKFRPLRYLGCLATGGHPRYNGGVFTISCAKCGKLLYKPRLKRAP